MNHRFCFWRGSKRNVVPVLGLVALIVATIPGVAVAGKHHTCVLLDTDTVRCWCLGTNGRLGYGNTSTIGDNESPA
jgi:hypothetical protein